MFLNNKIILQIKLSLQQKKYIKKGFCLNEYVLSVSHIACMTLKQKLKNKFVWVV